MFEGNFQEAGFAEAVEGTVLQSLDWQTLVAKLSAAQDLRSVYSRRKLAGGGNFARFSSAQPAVLNEIEPRVNRDALADCKDNEAIVPAAAQDADKGDREL